MLDAPLRRVIDPPLAAAGGRLAASGVTADALSLFGFALALAAMATIAMGATLWGLVLFLANRLADGLDGAVARARAATDRGGFLDITLDFIAYAGIVLAFAVLDPVRNALPAAFLLFTFMGTASSFLAFAVMAQKRGLSTEQRGRKSIYYLGGLTEGSETILFFVAFCAWPEWFAPLAWAFGAMCCITATVRIVSGWTVFSGPDGRPPT